MLGLNIFVYIYIVKIDVKQTGHNCLSQKNDWVNILKNSCNLPRQG